VYELSLKHVNEGKREGTKRQGRRSKQLLDDFKKTRGQWQLKEDSPVHTLCRTHFGQGCEFFVRLREEEDEEEKEEEDEE